MNDRTPRTECTWPFFTMSTHSAPLIAGGGRSSTSRPALSTPGAASGGVPCLRHPPLQLFGAESFQRLDLIPDQGQLDVRPNRLLHLVCQQVGVSDLTKALAVGE